MSRNESLTLTLTVSLTLNLTPTLTSNSNSNPNPNPTLSLSLLKLNPNPNPNPKPNPEPEPDPKMEGEEKKLPPKKHKLIYKYEGSEKHDFLDGRSAISPSMRSFKPESIKKMFPFVAPMEKPTSAEKSTFQAPSWYYPRA